jgi:hypothetical protein
MQIKFKIYHLRPKMVVKIYKIFALIEFMQWILNKVKFITM